MKAPFIGGSGSRADNRRVNTPARHLCRLWPGTAASLGAAVFALLAGLPAHAGDSARDSAQDSARDHERARAAVQSGQALPLATLLQRLQRSHPGQVLEVELEREHGRWVYEITLLQPGGRLLKLELDAATGAVLKARARNEARPPEPAPKPP